MKFNLWLGKVLNGAVREPEHLPRPGSRVCGSLYRREARRAPKKEVFTKINQSAAAVVAEVKKIAKAEPAASGQSPATGKAKKEEAATPAQKRQAAAVASTSSGARRFAFACLRASPTESML